MADPPEHLRPVLAVLRRAYPDGVAGSERAALLVALCEIVSEENLGWLMWAFAGDESVVAQNDAAAALSVARPPPAAVENTRQRLRDADTDGILSDE